MHTHPSITWKHPSLWHVLGPAAILLLLWAAAAAQTTQPRATPVRQGETLRLDVGQSTVVETPAPTQRVSVTDPKIADIQVVSPQQILVQGRAVGSTDLIVWTDQDHVWRARIDVGTDLQHVQAEMRKLFPHSDIELRQTGGVLVVRGALGRAEHADQLRRFLETSGFRYVDMTNLAGIQQVLIRVRVAEVSRTAIRTLGINAVYAGNDFFGGSLIGAEGTNPLANARVGVPAATPTGNLPFQFTSPLTASDAVTLFAGFPGADLEIFVQALAQNQYLRILAEPNLVALSGEEASFLAGGEFPIPVVQGAGATTSGTSIAIEYREFGVQLRFRPVVLGDGVIRLKVAPEVSDLTDVGAVEIQGFRVPALVTRRAETTLELKSGQTFGMAGLINRTVNARNSRVPGLGDVPILGSLFRSIRYARGETELVVLVTASLVEPMSVANLPPAPGVLHVTPTDWELYAMGRIEGKTPAKLSPSDAAWLRESGLDQLSGPGAWAAHDQTTPPSQSTLRPPTTQAAPAQ